MSNRLYFIVAIGKLVFLIFAKMRHNDVLMIRFFCKTCFIFLISMFFMSVKVLYLLQCTEKLVNGCYRENVTLIIAFPPNETVPVARNGKYHILNKLFIYQIFIKCRWNIESKINKYFHFFEIQKRWPWRSSLT